MGERNEIKFVQLSQKQYDEKDKQVILRAVQIDPTQTAEYKIKRNMDAMMGVVRNK